MLAIGPEEGTDRYELRVSENEVKAIAEALLWVNTDCISPEYRDSITEMYSIVRKIVE